ncbi:hypothetical protein CYV19_03985 [Natronobacterium gregoryi SP2]|uniref:Uncharacterized protein n=1 Tax=Natronobacterium gregoryi (strain ATCC 43098 / DSM 3393 / CCM 3738 / CIP 104747 / IAM 13177 / JCM 8860 / NBRC 102187 / NCIMB 2189 / SP2) TaxID=797304 RepID=A0A2J4JHT2_NATGS|nr:hypothetical protein CYV19_03985 [Natronobacterium gregoryi SP2]
MHDHTSSRRVVPHARRYFYHEKRKSDRRLLVPSQPSTDGSNRATPPGSTHQFRLGTPLVASQPSTD